MVTTRREPPLSQLLPGTPARTGPPLALQGVADFHILEPAGQVLYAYDATTGQLLPSKRASFDEVLTCPLISVAATVEARELGGPTTVYLDTTPEGTPGRDRAARSRPGQRRWRPDMAGAESIGGQPAAFTITEQGWYFATNDAVFESPTHGETWKQVL